MAVDKRERRTKTKKLFHCINTMPPTVLSFFPFCLREIKKWLFECMNCVCVFFMSHVQWCAFFTYSLSHFFFHLPFQRNAYDSTHNITLSFTFLFFNSRSADATSCCYRFKSMRVNKNIKKKFRSMMKDSLSILYLSFRWTKRKEL